MAAQATGNGFATANVEDSGGGEIDDIGASVKYLVDTGLVRSKDGLPSEAVATEERSSPTQ